MRSLLTVCLVVLASASVQADDWPQFRGPQRDGISREKGLLKAWPEGGPKLVRTIENLGLGYSCPAIVGDRLYVLGTRDKKTCAFCIDTKTGKEIWHKPFADIWTFQGNSWGDGPRSTPAVDGKNVYVLSSGGKLASLDTSKGNINWKVDLKKDFGGTLMSKWGGYCQSVLVDGDNVICVPGGKKGAVLALNKTSGKKAWQTTELTHNGTFASVIKAKLCGVDQYLVLTFINGFKGGAVSGISTQGKVLWTHPLPMRGSEWICPNPLVKGDKVYVTWGDRGRPGCRLLEVTKKGEKFSTKETYGRRAQGNMANEHGGVILVGDHVYGLTNARAFWTCQEWATGKIAWDDSRRLPCASSGTLVATPDRLYLLSDRGQVALIEASSKGWKEHGRITKLPKVSRLRTNTPNSIRAAIWTAPVIAHGKLYIRDHDLLFCYDIKK